MRCSRLSAWCDVGRNVTRTRHNKQLAFSDSFKTRGDALEIALASVHGSAMLMVLSPFMQQVQQSCYLHTFIDQNKIFKQSNNVAVQLGR